MLIEKNHNGSITISDSEPGYLFTKTYYGYSRKEAIEAFKCDLQDKIHEYIDAEDDSGFVTCNEKGEVV